VKEQCFVFVIGDVLFLGVINTNVEGNAGCRRRCIRRGTKLHADVVGVTAVPVGKTSLLKAVTLFGIGGAPGVSIIDEAETVFAATNIFIDIDVAIFIEVDVLALRSAIPTLKGDGVGGVGSELVEANTIDAIIGAGAVVSHFSRFAGGLIAAAANKKTESSAECDQVTHGFFL